ncbi:hypothetical protein E1A91_D01G136500v1 [Gossypium mustelinum]|uniref:Major facilitator superfamily (MFS) profile domain-containing protein n=1 Tax=Gossypium mustelinum TaxID=34275 RepID=A0A5D2W6W9_GOSMU|nr:hypothetical protein E1A91_D01G136500v1 [Gossypium mustelinum]
MSLKITNYFIFACLVAAIGGSLFGYDLGVFEDLCYLIQKSSIRCLFQDDDTVYLLILIAGGLLTLFTSSLYFAGLVSTFGASYVIRNKGRRACILVGAVSFFLGGAINAGAVNITMLIIGRILLDAGI